MQAAAVRPSAAWPIGVAISAAVLLVAVVGWRFSVRNSGTAAAPVAAAVAPPAPPAVALSTTFAATIANTAAAPASAPPGMAWISGGEFSMGANDPPDMNAVGMQATEDARPSIAPTSTASSSTGPMSRTRSSRRS
jgi:hypothetical protein